jgi:hypothetical protein
VTVQGDTAATHRRHKNLSPSINSGHENPRVTARLPWSCVCSAYVATFHSNRGPAALVLVHNVACDRPRHERRAVVLRNPTIPAKSLRRPLGRRGRAA